MSRGPARNRRLVTLVATCFGLVLAVAGVAVATETALKLLLVASERSLAVPAPSVRHGAVGVAVAVAGYAVLSLVGDRDGPDGAADDGDAESGVEPARDP